MVTLLHVGLLILAGSALLCAWISQQGTEQPQLRVVFSLTTIASRIEMIKPIVDQIVEGQTRPPDAVYLAVPPEVTELPAWLRHYNDTCTRPGILKVLRMDADYGPASKLLAAVAEGGEQSYGTLIIYGDDDVIYSALIVELHLNAQQSISVPAAFGTRQIHIGEGKLRENILEATGSISLRASLVPTSVFKIQSMPAACRLSDDYWISHHLVQAGVQLFNLPTCEYDFGFGGWPPSCGHPFHTVKQIQHVDALSETVMLDSKNAKRSGGDWRAQLNRYGDCRRHLDTRSEL